MQAVYVKRNIEARSCNHYCSVGGGWNITYSECVFVALGVKHKILIRRVFICGLSDSTIISKLSHERHDFRKECYWTRNTCFVFLYNVCLIYSSF